MTEKMIAVVRIRGVVGIPKPIKDTLNMLKLHKRNFCVVKKQTPSIMGMIRKAKDYVTWGIIDAETLKLLKEKRDKGKSYFRLNPPRKGYGRKGIKKPFSGGGALGNRGSKINDLLKRMI